MYPHTAKRKVGMELENMKICSGWEECDHWRGGKMLVDTSDRHTVSLGFNGLFYYDDGVKTLDVLLG